MFIISISTLLLHACGLITHMCVLLGASVGGCLLYESPQPSLHLGACDTFFFFFFNEKAGGIKLKAYVGSMQFNFCFHSHQLSVLFKCCGFLKFHYD